MQVINTKTLNRRGKSIEPKAATTEIPQITTYRSANHNKFTSSSSSEATSGELDLASTSYDTSSSTPKYSETTSTSDVTGEGSTLESRFSNDEAEVPSTTNFVPQFNAETTTETQEVTTETSTLPPSTTSKPKFRLKPTQSSVVGGKTRTQKNVKNEDFFTEPASIEHKHADARALELLRSLYSLASRWGRK